MIDRKTFNTVIDRALNWGARKTLDEAGRALYELAELVIAEKSGKKNEEHSQACVVRAWEALNGTQPDDPFGYLWSVMGNHFTDLVRAEQRERARRSDIDPATLEVSAPGDITGHPPIDDRLLGVNDPKPDEIRTALHAAPHLLTKFDLAKVLGVSDRTIRRWKKKGIFRTAQVGGREYVLKNSVVEFFERAYTAHNEAA